MPPIETVAVTLDKARTVAALNMPGLFPATFELGKDGTLEQCFDAMKPPFWLRSAIGAGGRGSLVVESIDEARAWMDYWNRRERDYAWVLHEYRALEEAILGVVGSMDKPSSPAGEAKHHFHNRLFGRSHDQREKFRQQILAVTLDDLRRVTQTYLRPELASTAVVTSASQLEATAALREELGLTVQEL